MTARSEKMVRVDVQVYAAHIAACAAYSWRHREAIAGELVDWVMGTHGDTWACESAGIRLCGGMSLPYWATIDARGLLLASRLTAREPDGSRPARRAVVRALAQFWASCSEHRPPAWIGLRANEPQLDTVACTMVSKAADEQSFATTFSHGPLDRRRLMSKWHLPRCSRYVLTDLATLFWCDPAHKGPQEIGHGAVSLYLLDAHAGVILLNTQPDAPTSAVNVEKLRAFAKYRQLAGKGFHSVQVIVPEWCVIPSGSRDDP